MKITLLEPPRKAAPDRSNDIANTTLSACLNSGYAAAVLEKAGHQVRIIEGYMEGMDWNDVERSIARSQPELLGVHMVYNWDDNRELYAFLSKVKEEFGIRYVAAYGYYPTFAAREILTACESIDYILVGEIENTFLDLASNPNDPVFIQGLAYRDPYAKRGVRMSMGKLVANLDDLPFPIRSASSMPGGEVNILGSRGCYGSCTFCYINPYYGLRGENGETVGRWRPRSPQNIVDEIDQISLETGADYFYFTDPNFYGPGKRGRERVLHLAELLEGRHIRFGIEARANDIEPETIRALKKAGLQDILVGLESGRDESLERLGKKTSVADNERALAVLRENGIEPSVGFIMFEPDSSLEDLRVNFDFLKRNRLLDKLETAVNVLYHHQIILQGSPSYNILREEGKLILSDHSEYEAETSYELPGTAAMAEAMRRITNHIFDYMQDTWQLSADGDDTIRETYDKISVLLSDSFEKALDLVEHSGPAALEKSDFVQKVNDTVDRIAGRS